MVRWSGDHQVNIRLGKGYEWFRGMSDNGQVKFRLQSGKGQITKVF